MDDMSRCPKCGSSNKVGADSCTNCGEKFIYRCPKCSSRLEPNSDKCPTCGVALKWPDKQQIKASSADSKPDKPQQEKIQDSILSPQQKARNPWFKVSISLIVILVALIALLCGILLTDLNLGFNGLSGAKPAGTVPVTTENPPIVPEGEGIPQNAKLVCIFFDDGWQSQYDIALPILLQYDFKATFGIITGSTGKGSAIYEYIDDKEIKDLANYGMDIASHTRTHPHLVRRPTQQETQSETTEGGQYSEDIADRLTDQQLTDEIIGSKEDLEKLGCKVRTFVYPFFQYDDRVIQYVKEAKYVCARTGGSNNYAYDLKNTDPNSRYSVPCYSVTGETIEQYKAVVNKASRYSAVCICYHFISDKSPVQTSTPVANFVEQMRYLKENGFTVVLLPDLFE